eukprot:jgi/Mesen1/3050/ME000018S02353
MSVLRDDEEQVNGSIIPEGNRQYGNVSDEMVKLIDSGPDYTADAGLDRLLKSTAAVVNQKAATMKQILDYTKLLSETADALDSRAQAARLEAAILKKTARLQEAESLRRAEELRRATEQRALEERKLQELRAEQLETRRKMEAAAAELAELNSQISASIAEEARLADLADLAEVSRPTLDEPGEGDESNKGTLVGDEGEQSAPFTVRKDARGLAAVVTMEATVKCAGEACLSTALGGDAYVALALQSITVAAGELLRSRYLRPAGADPVVHRRHHSLAAILAGGEIVSSRPMEPPSRFGHESFADALFKPRVEGDAEGWHRAPVEWVAYELNLMLGMDYVPPVAYRRGGVDVDFNHYEEGAFIHWVPNSRELKRVAAASWGVPVAHLLSDTRILDVLLNNSDRHHGHFLYGKHWADGAMRPILIDHAAGFRKEAVVHMEHENAFQTGPLRCVAAQTYLRLRFLDKNMVAEKFAGVLSEAEINDMMSRRDMVLEYLDNLVKERGYQRTVIE